MAGYLDEEPVVVDDLLPQKGAAYTVVDAVPPLQPTTGFGSPNPAALSSPVNPTKQLNFGLQSELGKAGADLTSPSTPYVGSSVSGQDIDYNAFILETLLWTSKVRSAFYFLTGLLLLIGAKIAVANHASIVSSLAYSLLFSLGINFVRAIISPKWQERSTWSGSTLSRWLASSATTTVHATSALHDAHLSGTNSFKTLLVALGLWTFALLGRAISGLDLLLAAFLLAFTVPALYTHFKQPVDQAVSQVSTEVKSKYEALDRKSKAGAVLIPLLVLMLVLSTRDRFVAIFVFLVYGRVLLKPAELQAIQKRVEPISNTISKLTSQAGNVAVGYADKYSLTPTPSKKKHL